MFPGVFSYLPARPELRITCGCCANKGGGWALTYVTLRQPTPLFGITYDFRTCPILDVNGCDEQVQNCQCGTHIEKCVQHLPGIWSVRGAKYLTSNVVWALCCMMLGRQGPVSPAKLQTTQESWNQLAHAAHHSQDGAHDIRDGLEKGGLRFRDNVQTLAVKCSANTSFSKRQPHPSTQLRE